MNRRFALRRHDDSGVPPPSRDEEAARRTGALLARLDRREWSVLTGVEARHGVDHVLVGPSGVFAITSRKPESAGARVRDGVLWLRRAGDARADSPGLAINRQALDAARTLQREIRQRTGRGPAVHAVVALWCEFPQGVAESQRIAFVHARELPAWLTERPEQLDELGRGEIVQALCALRDSAPRAPRLPHIGPRHRAA